MVSELKASIAAAYAAINAENYVLALRHARAARVALMCIPDSELQGEKIAITRDDVDLMINDLNRQANAQVASETTAVNGAGVQTLKTRFLRG